MKFTSVVPAIAVFAFAAPKVYGFHDHTVKELVGPNGVAMAHVGFADYMARLERVGHGGKIAHDGSVEDVKHDEVKRSVTKSCTVETVTTTVTVYPSSCDTATTSAFPSASSVPGVSTLVSTIGFSTIPSTDPSMLSTGTSASTSSAYVVPSSTGLSTSAVTATSTLKASSLPPIPTNGVPILHHDIALGAVAMVIAMMA
ncbi:uncharacterized protein BDR25DRAFT_314660 [Lindgomyces ingoldianus]|uniref:Uncharacterized protein n=1 Tax=Lindgomyces ingoldianus TaxID=673940 RepID=A0ACB6QWL4_9PLEO|nr:uncharacterized protein BDR25DRAFT_314660 [Lindgomyces ingoldianus]KAF2470467.1 hypothetical protein BDR25DRAFT_314660 [Lindgomyces ingoldianus]